MDCDDPPRPAVAPISRLLSYDQGSYLAFLGRLTAEKGRRMPSVSPKPSACRCASPPRFRWPRPRGLKTATASHR